MKKAIKRVAVGLVREQDRSWFAELSDKGELLFHGIFKSHHCDVPV